MEEFGMDLSKSSMLEVSSARGSGRCFSPRLSPRGQSMRESEKLLLSQSNEGHLKDIVDRARLDLLEPARVMVEVARRTHDPRRPWSAMTDRHLAEYFARTEEQAAQNPWYKAELRIARALVNLCGKFEADIMSSKPSYAPRMDGFGLPKFSFDLSKMELGVVVRRWMEGPFYGKKEDPADCPVVQPKQKGEDGAIRREKYERDELEYEKKRGITRVGCHADFSNWGVIAGARGNTSAEDARANSAQIVSTILNHVSAIAHRYGLRLVFHEISVVHTEASMRSVFNGEDWLGQTIFREREVETLKLIGSNTSSKSLQNLNGAVRLKYLYLDGCPLATNSGKTRANVFDSLTHHGPVAELRCLSLVGTSAHLSSDWLSKVESKCPKLALVFFTRRPGDKALGWSDVVMMQSMREPSLLPCGHVGDLISLRQIRSKLCPICRTPFTMDSVIPLKASITQLTRVQDSWKATVVDTLRRPLDDKVLYHECGEFFNLDSIRTLYGCEQTGINGELLDALKDEPCLRCQGKFGRLRVCYPRSAVEDESEFASLSDACGYFAVDST